jgi:hypothetical protein
MGGHVALRGEGINNNGYRGLVGKPEGQRPLGRHRHRWEDIKMHFNEIGWRSVDWIQLALNKEKWRVLVNKVMNLQFAQNVGNFMIS